jgi:hypothetical protein
LKGVPLEKPDSVRGVILETALFRERMIQYKTLELMSLLVPPNLFSEGQSLVNSTFSLMFPWIEIEEQERLEREREEFSKKAKEHLGD